MEGRCAVETWAEFGSSGTPCTSRVKCGVGTNVLFCTGSDEVTVFSAQERRIIAVLTCPGPVSDLVQSPDKQLLYVACRSGVYCVSLQFLLSRAQSSPADASFHPAEVKISSESLVVEEEGVLSLLLVGSVLLTLSRRDSSWMLILHSSPKQAVSSCWGMLGSFSLPLDSSAVHTGTRRRPVLMCVHSGDAAPPPSSSASPSVVALTGDHFPLEPLLFKLLFGIDAALARSPVILCGLPDGRLCFLPLRLPGSRLRVLHSLEQPVVFVGASVVIETGPGYAQCLVAVGELGRVVLMKTDRGGPDGRDNVAGFIERCVPGPVMCGCVDKKCLYYSTGSDLLVLNLSEGSSRSGSQERVEDTSSKISAPQRPISLNVCRVTALAEPAAGTAGGVQLLVLTGGGRLQRITLPQGGEDATSPEVPSTQEGRSVRDLLSAIGDVCERASALKTAIKSKNQILRRLNQVLNISFLLMDTSNGEQHLPVQEKPIRCHATTSWSRLLQTDSLNLICVLDNSCPYILERGWTLSIAVFPLSCPPSAGGESSSTVFSFPFHNLHPGETLEVTLPLAAAGDTTFPVTVSCSLVFSLSSLLGEEEVSGSSSCVSLPLNTLTVDGLHALRVNGPATSHSKATSQCGDTRTDAVQAFLSSCRTGCSGRGEGGGESVSKQQELYSARLRVSAELLRETLVRRGSDVEPPPNVCVSLLEWLMSDGPGGVKTGHGGDKFSLSSPVVHARAPNGQMVKLMAKEVESMKTEESMTTVDVQVESSSVAAVCQLHHAVLLRLQTLLLRAPERAASTKRVQSLGLRQALQRAERLLQQIQQSRTSEALSTGVSTGQTTRSRLGVYRELRENPLFII